MELDKSAEKIQPRLATNLVLTIFHVRKLAFSFFLHESPNKTVTSFTIPFTSTKGKSDGMVQVSLKSSIRYLYLSQNLIYFTNWF